MYDIAVIGGGIVGAAICRQLLLKNSKLCIAMIEKEKSLGLHQSKYNSGVIHAGVYYRPESLKAKLCTEGMRRSYDYLKEKKIKHNQCGKLIVATKPHHFKMLDVIYERSKRNKLNVEFLDNINAIKSIEPLCSGLRAIYLNDTGIVDWHMVTESFGKDFKDMGGDILLEHECQKFEMDGDTVKTICKKNNVTNSVKSKYVITAGGLFSDKMSILTDGPLYPKLIPFRGNFLKYKKGVHFTPKVDSNILLGPNVLLSLKREGYTWKDFDFKDSKEIFTYPGFWKLAFSNIGFGVSEILKQVITTLMIREMQQFVPSLKKSEVEDSISGVRAESVTQSGLLVDDFIFEKGNGKFSNNTFHIRNAPSPACTSSLAIASHVTLRCFVQNLNLKMNEDTNCQDRKFSNAKSSDINQNIKKSVSCNIDRNRYSSVSFFKNIKSVFKPRISKELKGKELIDPIKDRINDVSTSTGSYHFADVDVMVEHSFYDDRTKDLNYIYYAPDTYLHPSYNKMEIIMVKMIDKHNGIHVRSVVTMLPILLNLFLNTSI
ncbi:L-2-hydroxyglutarate dehydrogenase, mitochondrial [Intoshia linei]|uniref:L-2-hydroxyglutarate dehydrogenase, mitochondrial n=1 Tax=Intoshia linei TaxID=1819745 RepID=A0A177B249_9BILA|nr:L-2-hydroxyglutarate dehydrogenase, mitochondrial [Intoshia linei]